MSEEKKKIYQSVTLGLPELKMVLVHAGNDIQNAEADPVFVEKTKEQLDKKQAVRKIIEHLKIDM
jgi:hypothetical protein